MDKVDDGGPAFPAKSLVRVMPDGSIERAQDGMSLRDWFAGQALIGLVASQGHMGELRAITTDAAYAYADDMIKSRVRT